MSDDQQPKNPTAQLPSYLDSYDALVQHIRGQLDELNATEKGDRFAHLVQMLVPQADIGIEFDGPVLSRKKASDDGIDLTAQHKNGNSRLYIQAKLWIDRAETIDSILSKFQAYLSSHYFSLSGQQYRMAFDEEMPHFLIVTLSPLQSILEAYTRRKFASNDFFQTHSTDRRMHFIDGHQILAILQSAYRKLNEVPSDITLNLETSAIHKGNVYFGIVSSTELRNIHGAFGDALFFENVRDFQGSGKGLKKDGRTTVNDEIVRTITQSPEKLLERNNGIVFRASTVRQGSTPNQLRLSEGSVINGCQTTMCMVEHAETPCYVPVKIVETQDSWDVAKAANYQNPVDVIDLDLARNLRPQLAKRAAMASGVRIYDGQQGSAFQIIDTMYEHKVAYNETRLLYIGVFSRSPNNVFAINYTELMPDLIRRFYQYDPLGEETFDTLFSIQGHAQKALDAAKGRLVNPAYAPIFDRLYSDDRLSYRCLICILAVCALVEIDISERNTDNVAEFERMKRFLSEVRGGLSENEKRFERLYLHAVKLWMQATSSSGDDAEIRQNLYTNTKKLNFTNLYKHLCMEVDTDDFFKN